MTRLLELSAAALRIVGHIEMAIGAIILAGIVALIMAQVILNAGAGNPITWEQEAGAYALVWLTFVGASVGLKQMRHVTVVAAVTPSPPRLRAAVRMLCWAVVVWTMVVMMRELVGIAAIEGRAVTVALPIDLPRSWFFSVPLFITSGLMAWTAAHYFFANMQVLITGAAVEPRAISNSDGLGVDA
jgi:TRAP-type C4-dicarboxylate transport system permease small subunit